MSPKATPVARQDLREEDLSRYFEDYAETQGSALRFVAGHPVRTMRALRDVESLPRLRATLSGAAEGNLIRKALKRPRSLSGLQAATAVLALPERPEDYSQGSSKQTLRRKARSAVKAGVHWERVDDREERRRVLAIADTFEVEHHGKQRKDNDYTLEIGLWLVAYAADDRPLLLSVTPVDGIWALLDNFRTMDPGSDASAARYLMTQVLAEELSRRGVRYFVDHVHPVRLTNGLRHFQRMVGFRLVRLDVERQPRREGARIAQAARGTEPSTD